jgi:hypothetical protein
MFNRLRISVLTSCKREVYGLGPTGSYWVLLGKEKKREKERKGEDITENVRESNTGQEDESIRV